MRRISRYLTGAVSAVGLVGALTIGMTAHPGAASPAGANRAEAGFRAIVKLSNCSGSVFRFGGSRDGDQALVLTNGHCLGTMPEPGEVLTDQASERTFELREPDGEDAAGTLTADRMVYATMTDTDAAVYRLQETYGELRRRYDTEALTLADGHPAAGIDIEVVSGYWQETYSCGIDDFVPGLREDGYTSRDAIRYSAGCDTVGGTSGSPVIDEASNEIVGVNNTVHEGTGDDCSLGNPCEVDESGDVTVVPGATYGQQTYHLRACLSTRGTATTSRAACDLSNAA